MSENDGIIDFEQAKQRVVDARQNEREKALEKQFKKAMGWKDKRKSKKKVGPKGPKPKGRKR